MLSGCLLLMEAASRTLGAQPGVKRWTVNPAPVVDIGGGTAAPETFDRIPHVLRLANGTLVVPNEGTRDLRFFDASGRYLRTVGRNGSGPGEFRSVQTTLRKGRDSILVWDWAQRRLTLLAADGRIVNTTNIAPPPGSKSIPRPIAAFADGSLLGVQVTNAGFPFPGREGEVRTDSAVFVRFTAAGAARWMSPPMPHHDNFGMPGSSGNMRFLAPMDLPFGARLAWTTLGDSLLYGTGRANELALIGPNGNRVRTMQAASTRTTLASSMVQRFTRALEELKAGGGPSSGVQGELLAAIRKQRVPFPQQLAAHGELLVDETRHVWIQDGDETGLASGGLVARAGSRWWTVKAADGKTIARVEMPEGFRLDVIDADRVTGVWRDADDVEHVRVYRLVRAGG